MTNGLSAANVKRLRVQYGFNDVDDENQRGRAMLVFLARFKNPLVIILLIAASLSLFFGDRGSFFIIFSILVLSIGLDFANTYRSEKAAEALKDKVRVKVKVVRNGQEVLINVREIVPGDIVRLGAGSVIPADGEVIESKDLFTNEAALTGESFPQAKPPNSPLYMGSGVVSGTGLMQVLKTGKNTKYAHIAKSLHAGVRPTEFDREIKDFSLLIIRITFFLVVFVFLVNVLFHRNVLDSVLFSLALAVGLTPELLPLIINLNLAKGSLKMAREGVIVKQLSAVQNFGSMDVLCTDKTGTLTEDKIALIKYVDGQNQRSEHVLLLGYLSSVFSTGFENPLDAAVRNYKKIDYSAYQKIDEIPFDFERKREAVIIHHYGEARRFLIVKGAPEETLQICTSYGPKAAKLSPKLKAKITQTYEQLSRDGFRVLAIAEKQIEKEKRYEPKDEQALIFQGFLAFLDPAKETVAATLKRMQQMDITIKIITGDNLLVTQKIARDIGLMVHGTITGEEFARLTKRERVLTAEHTTIFARVNPEQKMQIIDALKANGHVVGYMGDGINDAPSLRAADVGVSVNNAVDVAKSAADFILLKKNLHELLNGVSEGRKTFANTMKYLRMSLSSNFGNMFSMAAASLFLPFLPLFAGQILLNNLLYDGSQIALPLDNVDTEEILKPRTMNLSEVKHFMLYYGLLSSAFDFLTFAILIVAFRADQAHFQAGWFIESILTQVFVVYIIRSRLLPFKDSRPSWPLVASTLLVSALALVAVLSPVRVLFRFAKLPLYQLGLLVGVVIIYLVMAEALKERFYRNLATSQPKVR